MEVVREEEEEEEEGIGLVVGSRREFPNPSHSSKSSKSLSYELTVSFCPHFSDFAERGVVEVI
jgi:hypothetical protein